LGQLPVGASIRKVIAVAGLNLTGDITLNLQGDNAFNLVKTTLNVVCDSVEVNFAPIAEGKYEAVITVSANGVESKTINLTGSAVQLPFKVSDETTDYWYYLQFDRRRGVNKVFTNKGVGQVILQEPRLDNDSDSTQLWKITGSWDKYKIVAYNKVGTTPKAFYFNDRSNSSSGRYTVAELENADIFRAMESTVAPFGTWSFYQMSITSGNRHFNDNEGSQIGHWSMDNGFGLYFFPTFGAIIPSSQNLKFGNVDTELNATAEAEFVVIGNLLTNDIPFDVIGADASAFTIENITEPLLDEDGEVLVDYSNKNYLPKEGGTLKVTFNPGTEKRIFNAQLSFKSTGVADVYVAITANSQSNFPVLVSTAAESHWYRVQFTRRAGDKKVVTLTPEVNTPDATKPLVTTRVKQLAIDESNNSQLWKFMGNKTDGFQWISFRDGALYYKSNGDKYDVGESGVTGDKLNIVEGTGGNAGKWQMENKNVSGKYLNDQGGNWLCNYSANDGGAWMTFLPASPTTSLDVNRSAIQFALTEPGTTTESADTIVIAADELQGAITYQLAGVDQNVFSITESGWNANVGGKLVVTFAPNGEKDYLASLIITTPNTTPRTVLLSGIGSGGTAIKEVSDEYKGEVIAVQYYNLQGIEVNAPNKTGVYIVKKTYSTKKTEVKKMIVVKK
jgi:hypothetical protein